MGRRGAPNKTKLDYFPKMVDFYEDEKIFDLLDRYGPLGVTIYDCILCIVYRNGYYAEIPLDKLSRMIVKMIGNKWVKNTTVVVQVVHFCSEIGLLDDDLMTKNIITSVGIQRRFYKVAVKLMKRRPHMEEYWLLEKEKDEEALLNAPINPINTEETRISSEEIPSNSELSPMKEKEINKSIYLPASPENHPFKNQELEDAFQSFLKVRYEKGDSLTGEQIRLLREELFATAGTDEGRIAAAKRAAAGGWKNFWPIRTGQPKKKKEKKDKNRFNNFTQREYDYSEMERKLLASQQPPRPKEQQGGEKRHGEG